MGQHRSSSAEAQASVYGFAVRALPRDVVLDHEGSVQLDRAALRHHLEDRLADLVNLESAAVAPNELQEVTP
jgi:hypothetical protein